MLRDIAIRDVVIIESVEPSEPNEEEYLRRLEDMSRRRPFEGFTTEEVMAMTRSEV